MTDEKLNLVLDATMLDTYQSCPCKFNYRFNHNKVTITKAKPLDRGTLVHNGLEYYFKALQSGSNWDNAKEAMKHAVLATSHESDLSAEDVNRSYEVLEETCNRWKYRDLEFEILAVEQSFSYVLHEDENFRLILMGKIDLLVNYHFNGQTYERLPIDHKTYERDFPVKRLTNQFCNYAYACGSNYLFVNRIGFQTSIKPEIKHKFIPLSYDPVFLSQWRDNTVRIAKLFLDSTVNEDWPMNLTSCDKYNRLCEYHGVCDSSGIEAKMWRLNSDYNTAEPWDVGSVLGKDKE